MRWLRVVADDGGLDTKAARYALSGVGARERGRVRVVARLVETESGPHLWAERFDAPADDLFAVQDWIAERVAGLIESELMQAETSRARSKPPARVDAYDLYLQAFALVCALTGAEGPTWLCLPLFWKKALALDPDYAAAHALLAWAHEICFKHVGFEDSHRREAIAHGRAAIEHASDDPTALALGGFVLALLGVDRDVALAAIARAAEINPASATVACLGAHANAVSGRVGATGVYAARALDLSPSHPLAFLAHLGLGARATSEGRWDDGAACTARAIQLNPGFGTGYLLYAIGLALGGLRGGSLAELSSSAGPRT